MTITLYL